MDGRAQPLLSVLEFKHHQQQYLQSTASHRAALLQRGRTHYATTRPLQL